MKALSIRQPWAWLIASGHKDVENRTWYTRFRGKFLIHASLKFDDAGLVWVRGNFPHIQIPTALPTGCVVGWATLEDCLEGRAVVSPWAFGPFCFMLKDAELWDTPEPGPGALRWFEFELPSWREAQP